MPLSWDPSLTTGFVEIDEQHQELFRRVDVLLGNMRRGQLDEELEKLFDFLDGYVREHFATEERLMAAHDYPLAGPHRGQHRAFAQIFQERRREVAAAGCSPALIEKLSGFLLGWLQEHIGTADRALGEFLIAAGTAVVPAAPLHGPARRA
jgi:hemerythrin